MTNNRTRSNSNSSTVLEWEDRIALVRRHYEAKGYRVHSGLQFGCELVLYADNPSLVHSDFCVHVVPEDGRIDWRNMQTLVRSMPDLHKTLILAHLRRHNNDNNNNKNDDDNNDDNDDGWTVDELALATEHAPFRHKRPILGATSVGSQRKRPQRPDAPTSTDATSTTKDGAKVQESTL